MCFIASKKDQKTDTYYMHWVMYALGFISQTGSFEA